MLKDKKKEKKRKMHIKSVVNKIKKNNSNTNFRFRHILRTFILHTSL